MNKIFMGPVDDKHDVPPYCVRHHAVVCKTPQSSFHFCQCIHKNSSSIVHMDMQKPDYDHVINTTVFRQNFFTKKTKQKTKFPILISVRVLTLSLCPPR